MQEQLPTINIIIIIITGYISFISFSNSSIQNKYIFDVRNILHSGQYYRIISSAFLHVNLMHLLFNLFSLYSFGQYIELGIGKIEFLLIYFISIIGGNLLSLAIHRKQEYRALGASGGVSGIIFASIFLYPEGSIFIFPIPFAIPSWTYAVFFIIVSIYGIQSKKGNIGHDAHLGGAIVGLLVTAILFPEIILQNFTLFLFIIFSVTVFLVIYLRKIKNIYNQ